MKKRFSKMKQVCVFVFSNDW